MSELIDKAIVFATERHSGQVRKFKKTPYILHPLEVAVILSTITDDENTVAAGLLHDTVEDTDTVIEEIKENFGERVFTLVASETEDKHADRPPESTWEQRKQESLTELKNTSDIEIKKMWLADKLSNMRSFYRVYTEHGDEMWKMLNQKDKAQQAWYYRTVAECVSELSDTAAYKEYEGLTDKIFGGVK